MKKMKMKISNDLTFEQGVEEYIRNCKTRNLRQGTIKHYREASQQLYKYIGADTLIQDMSKKTVEDMILQIQAKDNINSASLNTYVRDLKTFMYYFMKKEYLSNFTIESTKVDKQPIETYTDAELKKMLKKPNLKQCSFTEYKTWVIVNFLLSTGIRKNSLINIKIKDIDFENKVVYINVTKNRKVLIIPLNNDIVRILEEYIRYREGNQEDYLFCNVYGKQVGYSTIYHSLYEYNKSRGVETTGMHRFRHTFAKKWILMGGSVVTLQKILGHSSLAITENYLNILVSEIRTDVEEFNILKSLKNESIKIKGKN